MIFTIILDSEYQNEILCSSSLLKNLGCMLSFLNHIPNGSPPSGCGYYWQSVARANFLHYGKYVNTIVFFFKLEKLL